MSQPDVKTLPKYGVLLRDLADPPTDGYFFGPYDTLVTFDNDEWWSWLQTPEDISLDDTYVKCYIPGGPYVFPGETEDFAEIEYTIGSGDNDKAIGITNLISQLVKHGGTEFNVAHHDLYTDQALRVIKHLQRRGTIFDGLWY